MTDPNIVPERITKPIQLLAAWLAGLILVNGSFLGAAATVEAPDWARAALVVASIVNVPLFLACLFLLQTKFRPEMQEDSYYSKYLEQNTGTVVSTSPVEAAVNHLRIEIQETNQRYAETIAGLDAGLKALSLQLTTSKSEEPHDSLERDKLIEVVKEVTRSARALERAKEHASDAQLDVQMNDLLPEADMLRKELWQQRISIDRTFGTGSKDPEVPKIRIIGFGKGVPLEQLRKVIRVSKNFGFDHINFADKEFNANTIYIGSYIYRAKEEPQSVKLSAELLELIEREGTNLYDVIVAIERARA